MSAYMKVVIMRIMENNRLIKRSEILVGMLYLNLLLKVNNFSSAAKVNKIKVAISEAKIKLIIKLLPYNIFSLDTSTILNRARTYVIRDANMAITSHINDPLSVAGFNCCTRFD